MGNTTSKARWSARERIAWIGSLLYWRGWLRRQDLCEQFGVSIQQASADIAAYQLEFEDSLDYDTSAKRYVAKDASSSADYGIESALPLLSRLTGNSAGLVGRIDLPQHRIPGPQTRDIVRALINRRAVDIYYFSVHSNSEQWRTISPRALAHDGYRWHVRAWCHVSQSFRDFVLGRVDGTRPPSDESAVVPEDREWNEFTTLRIAPHRSLTGAQRKAIERDFGMKKGATTLRVRKALLRYTLFYLRLAEDGDDAPRLQLAKSA